MKRRCLSLWLPDFPIERLRRARRRRGLPFPPETAPLALWQRQGGGERLVAVNAVARQLGIQPGLGLADARAILPELHLLPAEPELDRLALEALGHWCRRWTPLPALDPPDGLLLDITGCTHLFGGEEAMCADISRHFARLGFTVRSGIADGPRAARVWTRFGAGGVLPAWRRREALSALPPAALDLEPHTCATLLRLGFRRLGELDALPRTALVRRFGDTVVRRLDALLGEVDEPFEPLAGRADFSARLGFAEPIGRREDIEAASDRLLTLVCRELEHAGCGARRLVLRLLRLDGGLATVELALGRPLRDPPTLGRLLRLRLDGVDPGFGFECAILDVVEAVPLSARQDGLLRQEAGAELDRLIETLRQRLGPTRVLRLEPVASHLPERAMRLVDASVPVERADWLAPAPRPLRLFVRPPHIEAMARVPDGPPAAIRLGGRMRRIVHARGPERILPEWWRPEADGARLRDHYELVDAGGRHLWVRRSGLHGEPQPPVWQLCGLFA